MTGIYDLVVVGGGVNGAALARHAAWQGKKVLLLEAGDFAQETSSASSKLIHGGLRYLEHFDLPLVSESLKERELLGRTCSHLVEARRFLFPINRLNRNSRFVLGAGLFLYDLLAGWRGPRSRWHGRKSLGTLEPEFRAQLGGGAFEYRDSTMDDARLTLENMLDAASLGAELRNYHRFTGVEEDRFLGEKVMQVTALDRLRAVDRTFLARKVAFCLGPWADLECGREFPGARLQLLRSQGVHLFVEKLPFEHCFILPVPNTGRYFFILPFAAGHLVGTTETEVGDREAGPFLPREQDLKELRDLFKLYFPQIDLKEICTTCGVRPLAIAKAKTLSAASRKHRFLRLHDLAASGVGGKYTTHRVFAGEFFRFLFPKAKGTLAERPFPGNWSEAPEEVRQRLLADGFSEATVSNWCRRYGRRALEVGAFIGSDPDRRQMMAPEHGLLKGEVLFAIEREWARRPEDFFRRRTDIFFSPDGGVSCYEAVREIFRDQVPGSERLEAESGWMEYLKAYGHRGIPPVARGPRGI